MAAGATDNGPPGATAHYDPRYYAANVLDPDGYSLEFVFKSWPAPTTMSTLILWQPTGYTGSMVARHARATGLDIVIGGRDASALAVAGSRTGSACRIACFRSMATTAVRALAGVDAVLNCAGPFARHRRSR